MIFDNLKLPNDGSFIDDLVLQRTDPFNALGGGPALGHWMATGEKAQLSAFLRDNAGFLSHFLLEVCTAMEREADALVAVARHDRFDRVISIGPGNGLFEAVLHAKYGYDGILLIDIEESTGVHRHGFNAEGSGYASLAATRRFMAMNGVPEAAIRLCNPRLEDLPPYPCDLLVSLLSMGFHYPCDAYADFIMANLQPDGLAVFDKRNDAPDAGFDRLMTNLRLIAAPAFEKRKRIYIAGTPD